MVTELGRVAECMEKSVHKDGRFAERGRVSKELGRVAEYREECLHNWEEYGVEKSAYIIGKSRDWIKVSKELRRVAEWRRVPTETDDLRRGVSKVSTELGGVAE